MQVETVDEGWIKLHRKIINSQVFQSEGLFKVWLWCLLRANHQDQWVPVKTGRGTTEVLIKRGQFIFGRKAAAKALKMKPTTVQDRMQKLVNMQNLVTKPVTHYSIVTVQNYELYQAKEIDDPSPNPSPNRQPTVTNKNVKNLKNNGRVKNPPDPRVKDFLSFWGETFQRETGQPYIFSFGKEGNLTKTLLKVYSLETLQDMVQSFFRDEQCRRRGLTIGIFYLELNRLLGQKAMDPLEQVRRELIKE